ncbi:MAG: dihydrolipoamide acetyltransferase family protein [Acidobacteriota bacterium]
MKHVIIMPDLGQTTSEAKIVSWLKQLGDQVAMGEPLLEVETDKATMDVEAYVGGYLRRQLAAEGDVVSASHPVAILTDTPEEDFDAEPKPVSAAPVSHDNAVPKKVGGPTAKGVAAVPAARALASQLGVELSSVTGTGAGGLITKADVERHAASSGTSEGPAQLSSDRKALQAMASLTSTSKSTIPHFYVTIDLDMVTAERWRKDWNEAHPELKASVNDCLVRAASAALSESPRMNLRWSQGRYESGQGADVLIVVGTDEGLLLVPVTNPQGGTVEESLTRMKSLLGAAREGRLQPLSGQTTPALAISNLGMFGVKEFSAIIPPGCTAILAAGAVREKVVARNGKIEVRTICTVTVSADHRVADGIAVAKFLERMQIHLNRL